MTDETKPDDCVTVEVIYMGKRRLSDGKDGMQFITFDQYDSLISAGAHASLEYAGSPFSFKKGEAPIVNVGGVYTAPCRLDKLEAQHIRSIRFNEIRPSTSGLKPQPEHVSLMQAADTATRQRTIADQVQSKVASQSSYSHALRDLAWIYRQLPNSQRNGFKLNLLNDLDGYK